MSDAQEVQETTPAAGDPVLQKAQEVLARGDAEGESPRRGPGRPPGSKNRKKSKRDRTRPPRASMEAADRLERPAAEPAAPPEPPSEAELRGIGRMFGALWRVVGARLHRRALSASEELELAEAAHPVLVKYGGGALDRYGAEIGLGITLWGLWESTVIEPELPPELETDAVAGV